MTSSPVQKAKYIIKFCFCLAMLNFAGCLPGAQIAGENKKVNQGAASKINDEETEETEELDSESVPTKKPIKPSKTTSKSFDQNSENKENSTADTVLNTIGPSKLNWDGVTFIGTNQLFLIPIE